MKQLVEMAIAGSEKEDVERAFRRHFASLNVTHLYCFLLHAVRAPSPMVCASYGDDANKTFWMVPFP